MSAVPGKTKAEKEFEAAVEELTGFIAHFEEVLGKL